METMQIVATTIGIVAFYFLTCIRILLEYQRGVIFRLGRALPDPKGPGIIMVFWPVDRMVRVTVEGSARSAPV